MNLDHVEAGAEYQRNTRAITTSQKRLAELGLDQDAGK
jgi:hypothetical protein